MIKKVFLFLFLAVTATGGLWAQQWYRLTLRNTAQMVDMTVYLEAATRTAATSVPGLPLSKTTSRAWGASRQSVVARASKVRASRAGLL